MVTVKVSILPKDVVDMAKVAINNQLFVKNWGLIKDLMAMLHYRGKRLKLRGLERPYYIIAIVTIDFVPIAVGVVSCKDFSAYVVPLHRRKGLGTLMYNEICKHYPSVEDRTNAYLGVKGSKSFFKSLGIEARCG